MGRPPHSVGTYGKINTKQIGKDTFWAEAWFRTPTGHLKRVRKHGPTEPAAIRNLKDRLVILTTEATGGTISGDTRMAAIADAWIDEIDRQARQGGPPSKGTVRQYRGYVKNWVKPAIGELQAREAEMMVGSFDRLIQRARDERSYEAAASVRSVLGSICAYAIRQGAMRVNPVKSTSRLVAGEKKEIRALTAEERADIKAKLIELAEKRQRDKLGRPLGGRGRVWRKLPDLHDCMLSTGIRIGELLAIDGDDVLPAERRVLIRYHLVRVEAEGMVREPLRKGNEPELDLKVPEWSVPTWRRLKLTSGGGPIFPSNKGRWLDPSTMINRLQEAFVEIGYPGITSHVWRKTVTDVLHEAGLPVHMIADQLGNTPAVVERYYRRKFRANDTTATVLEGLAEDQKHA
jgi:integrase